MRGKNLLLLLALVSSLAILPSRAVAEDEDNDCQKVSLANAANPITGTATLCASEDGIRGQITAHHLIPGDAYTVWFVYFDNPSSCAVPNNCSGADLVNPAADPVGVFGRFSSGVADEDGNARFSGAVHNFTARSGSQVWYALFVHGPASNDNKSRARQLLTPETPGLGAPGEGVGTRKGFGVATAIFKF